MNQEADPPFIRDDELVVRCSHGSCDHTTTVGIDVDGATVSDDGTGWRITFAPTADGRLEVDNVECPDHRIDDAIDELADAQRNYAVELAQTKKVADEIVSD